MKRKLQNKKGFTLAELLIVVAIIAVLVAVSIPVLNNQLEKSRDAVTVSNIRAAYAEATTEYITSNGKAVTNGNVDVKAPDASSKVVVTVSNVVVKGEDATKGLSGLEAELPFTVSSDNAAELNKVSGKKGSGGTVNVTFTFTVGSSDAPTFGFPTT